MQPFSCVRGQRKQGHCCSYCEFGFGLTLFYFLDFGLGIDVVLFLNLLVFVFETGSCDVA